MDNIILRRSWISGSMVKVDSLDGQIFTGENEAHTFEIAGVSSSGASVPITGTITGRFLSSDNLAHPLTGSIANGVATVTLTKECYLVPGHFVVSIYADDGNAPKICIYCGVGNVFRTAGDSVAYPSATIPDLEDLLQDVQAAIASCPASHSAIQAAVAPNFVQATANPAGTYVWYDGSCYYLPNGHTAGAAWADTAKTDAVIGNDVADLKSISTKSLLKTFRVLKAIDLGDLVVNGATNPETGANMANSAKNTRTGYIALVSPFVFNLNESGYEYCIWTYSGTTSGSAVSSQTGGKYITGPTLIDASQYIRIGFRRSDGEDLTTDTSDTASDFYKILHGCAFYELTDNSVSIHGAPADAEAVNENYLHDTKIVINGTNVSTYSDCDNLPVNNGYYVIQTAAITNGFLHAAYNTTHTLLMLGGTTQIAYPIYNDRGPAFRVKNGSVWGAWEYGRYDLYPSGDDTDRAPEIAPKCTAGKTMRLAPGEYYFDSMVIGGHLVGAGMNETKLIFKDSNSSGHNYALRLLAHGSVSDLTVEMYNENGTITPIEDYTLGINGLRIEGTGSDDTQRFACTVENVRIQNFSGCGLYVKNTGYNPASGSCFHNVHAEYCSCGIYIGEYAEFHALSDSWANYCYTGIVVIGANHTITGCDFSINKICIAMPNVDGLDNVAHGIINGCHAVHTGWNSSDADWNEGYIAKIGAQASSELISNCIFANGKMTATDKASTPLYIVGCDFKQRIEMVSDHSRVVISSSIMNTNDSTYTITNGGVIRRKNCWGYNGNTELADVV